MNYIDTIKSITPLSLDDIIKTAKQHVPAQYRQTPWNYPGLAHGTAILQDEEQLCCYLASYGEMTCLCFHKVSISQYGQKY